MYKILVVDDEPFIREGLKKIIEGQYANFCVSGEAEDGTDALEIIAANKPDIVITDIKMIEMDGPELIKRVDALYGSTVKFIVLSAYGDFQYAQSTMKYGVYDYILKPIDSKELLEAIHRITKEKDHSAVVELEYQSGLRSMMLQEMKRFIMGGGYTSTYEKMLQYFEIQEEAKYRCAMVELSREAGGNDAFINQMMSAFQSQKSICKCIIDESLFRYHFILQEPKDAADSKEQMRNLFKRYHQNEMRVYIGNAVNGFRYISESYINSRKAYDLRFYDDDALLVYYENTPEPNDMIYKIQQYLKEHYKTDLKIKDVADVFYLNPVYLGQFFKKKTGVYMNDYINELRIEEAKKLLKNTKYKVYEIATMIGFVNSDYFTTKFEKMVGMTPIQYRKGE